MEKRLNRILAGAMRDLNRSHSILQKQDWKGNGNYVMFGGKKIWENLMEVSQLKFRFTVW